MISLDATDLRILDRLQTDAGLTNLELAAEVSTSPATCLRRVKRLEDAGVIERRVAILSPAHLGSSLIAISEVSLDAQGAEHLDAFEARALARDEVQQCYRVSPGPDFILVLAVRDMPAWNDLVRALYTQDANVRNVRTFFSVQRSRFGTRLPLTASAAPVP